MPKTRKPRKAYVPKRVCNFCVEKQYIEIAKSVFTDACLLVKLKLATGDCRFSDAAIIRDALNFSTTIIVMAEKEFEQEWYDLAVAKLDACREGFRTWYVRGLEKGALDANGISDNSVRFVATGDEIRAMQIGFDYVDGLIQDRLETTPVIAFQWFRAMQLHLSGKGAGTVRTSATEFKKAMRFEKAKSEVING